MGDMESLRVVDESLTGLLPVLHPQQTLARRNAALAADLRRTCEKMKRLISHAMTYLSEATERSELALPETVRFLFRWRAASGEVIALSSRGDLFHRRETIAGKFELVQSGVSHEEAALYVHRQHKDFVRIPETGSKDSDELRTEDDPIPEPARLCPDVAIQTRAIADP